MPPRDCTRAARGSAPTGTTRGAPANRRVLTKARQSQRRALARRGEALLQALQDEMEACRDARSERGRT